MAAAAARPERERLHGLGNDGLADPGDGVAAACPVATGQGQARPAGTRAVSGRVIRSRRDGLPC